MAEEGKVKSGNDSPASIRRERNGGGGADGAKPSMGMMLPHRITGSPGIGRPPRTSGPPYGSNSGMNVSWSLYMGRAWLCPKRKAATAHSMGMYGLAVFCGL